MADGGDMPVPAIRLVGWSGSGKTVLGVKLVAELRSRGHRIGVIKHAVKHPAPPDQSHKDTGRYADAGADVVAGAFEDAAVIRIPSTAVTLESLLAMMAASVDLVIVEGYNDTALPSVVVQGDDAAPRDALGEVIAVVDGGAADGHFASDDVSSIADVIERWFSTRSIWSDS